MSKKSHHGKYVTRKDKGQTHRVSHCSICGEIGHKRQYHETHATKICCDCKRELPNTEFTPQHRKTKYGVHNFLYSYCRECSNIRTKLRYRSNFRDRLIHILGGARTRSQNNSIDFSLTIEDLETQYKKQSGLCFYSGRPLSLETGNWAISLDRIDPYGPYSKENIVLSCWLVNGMKRQQTPDEFIALCKEIIECKSLRDS